MLQVPAENYLLMCSAHTSLKAERYKVRITTAPGVSESGTDTFSLKACINTRYGHVTDQLETSQSKVLIILNPPLNDPSDEMRQIPVVKFCACLRNIFTRRK